MPRRAPIHRLPSPVLILTLAACASAEPPQLLLDVRPGPAWSRPTNFRPLLGRVVFDADNNVTGLEPWTSDGTAAGTRQVHDFVPMPGPAYPVWCEVSATLAVAAAPYFVGNVLQGNELFTSTLQPGGTALLTELCPAACTGVYGPFYRIGSGASRPALFVATPGGREQRLWRTDGTPAGTFEIADFEPASPFESISVMAVLPDAALISVRGDTGEQLWKTSGTIGGHQALYRPGTVADPGSIRWAYLWNGAVFVMAEDRVHPRNSLFELDTIAGGATFRQSLTAQPQFNPSLAVFDPVEPARAFMSVYELSEEFDPLGNSLWVLEDPTSPPVLLARFPPDTGPSARGFQVPTVTAGGAGNRGRAFWTYEPIDDRTELWTSDGTPQGTVMLRVFREIAVAAVLGASILLSADDGEHGGEWWISDGTVPGTRLAAEIAPGPATGTPIFETNFQYPSVAIVGDRLYFAATDSVAGFEPWSWRHPLLMDCDGNAQPDYRQIAAGTLHDANHDSRPDQCQCLGDWDGGGGPPSLDDILAFLRDYFGGAADTNHDGGTTVQDVFDFLVLYFRGCP